MTTAKHYYEAHVTIDPVFGERREQASDVADFWGFKLAKLLMDKCVPSQLDTFMTAHATEFEDIVARTRKCVRVLQRQGFHVRRYKIEDTVLDSRISDELELLK